MGIFDKSNFDPTYLPPHDISSGRVRSIILDETHPLFDTYGQWDSIGTVFYDDIESPRPYRPEEDNFDPNLSTYATAKPLFPQYKAFPLINEVVILISAPSLESSTATSARDYYYISALNLWNSQQNNVLPDQIYNEYLSDSQTKSIQEVEAGSPQINNSTNLNVEIGNTFVTKKYIYPLRPYEGDVIQEGRWGNSIRLGSTVTGSNNLWSNAGNNGDPITLIRNGQYGTIQTPGKYILENINLDDSSIYLTSNQQIPLVIASSNDYLSYPSNPPTLPNEYDGKQIILNSGRLVLNSDLDHILLSSQKSINLNSQLSVNIDARSEFVVQTPSVYLGDTQNTQPLVLGNDLVNLLTDLVSDIDSLATSLSNQINGPDGTPLAPTAFTAQLISAKIPEYKTRILNTLSNVSNTI
tara:strand:+ start:85 stop:1320 length:1236 start_codon:yes stop_codon:yes gene_type:complete